MNDPDDNPMRDRAALLGSTPARGRSSLSLRYMSEFAPIVVVVFCTVIALDSWLDLRHGEAALRDKLAGMTARYSLLLSAPLWEGRGDQIDLLVAMAIADTDVRGIAVLDAAGTAIANYGTAIDEGGDLTFRASINHFDGENVIRIGAVLLAFTDENLLADVWTETVYHAGLGVFLLLAAIAAAHFVLRSTVGVPLQKLLAAIRIERESGARIPVDWKSDDQVGQVVAAYNALQIRQRQTEAELKVARQRAEQASKAKSDFLANMSHELRTPLNSIIGFAEIIGSPQLGLKFADRHAEYASSISFSARHLLALINDILDISRIEAGGVELRLEPVRIDNLFHACELMVAGRARAKAIALSLRVEHGPEVVLVDPKRMQQILVNLVSNAIKFTPEGGRVDVDSSASEDGGCIIRVSDTGRGIANEELQLVLEPFAQAGNAYEAKYEGTGLGLPISKSLAELHGGTLQIESALGSGTTVTVRLPPTCIVRELPAAVFAP